MILKGDQKLKDYKSKEGTELKEIRKALGMTQKEFSDLFGVQHNTISEWESGKTRIPNYVYIIIGLMDKLAYEKLKGDANDQ